MTNGKTALVLGATGGIGGEMRRELASRGWRVTALARRPPAAASDGVRWIAGDALRADDVAAAAAGAALIVHAVNPPGYRNWGELVLPMLASTIAAAKRHGARILLPGTVYNYGPAVFAAIDEDSPQHPVSAKGAIRAEMEKRLAAAANDGVPVLIVRAGDFFGPASGNNWFGQALVKPGRPVTRITLPGKRGVGHQWAYLPDVAETMMQLIERVDALPRFARFHMKGHWDHDGLQMAGAIARAAGLAKLKTGRFPWRIVALLSPFVPLFRELAEMRYLWTNAVFMDNAKLRAALGEEPHTPLDEAVRAALTGMGCLAV
jgi:nucleoside-diphosphate-sugar epimerase